MKIITLYAIDDGDRESHIIGYATTETIAKNIARGRGFWGSDAGVYEQKLKVYESVDDFESEKAEVSIKKQEDIKLKALSKLTEEEKLILNLK